MLHNPKAQSTARATMALYFATLAALVITTFYPAPVEGVSVPMMLAIKLVPLLPFVPAVLKGNNRGLIWMSFVIIFYFTQFVVSAWLSEGGASSVILAALTVSLFTMAMVHLKVNRPIAA